LQDQLVCGRGLAAKLDESELKHKLNYSEVHIKVVLNRVGKAKARMFTCDLTEGYIQINGSYRT
jgi:glutamate N-acetyltransferase/amino-acid N-acetyltransferase